MAFPRQGMWQWSHQGRSGARGNSGVDDDGKACNVRPPKYTSKKKSHPSSLNARRKKQPIPERAKQQADTVITTAHRRREEHFFNAMQPLIDGAWRRRQHVEHFQREAKAYLGKRRPRTSSPSFRKSRARQSHTPSEALPLSKRLENFEDFSIRPATALELRAIMGNGKGRNSKTRSKLTSKKTQRPLTSSSLQSKQLPAENGNSTRRCYSAMRRHRLNDESEVNFNNWENPVDHEPKKSKPSNLLRKHDFYNIVSGRKQLIVKSISPILQNLHQKKSGKVLHIVPDMKAYGDVNETSTDENDMQLIFIDLCHQHGIIPEPFIVQYFIENRRVMDFNDCSLGDKAVSTVISTLCKYLLNQQTLSKDDDEAVPLRLETLLLRSNRINQASALSIANLLGSTARLIRLDLSDNIISARELETVQDSLQTTTTLISLVLDSIKVSSASAKVIGNILEKNKSIKELSLKSNNINAKCVKNMFRSIAANKCLEKIDLGWNILQSEGFFNFLAAILHNNSIKDIRLPYNGIGSMDKKSMAKSIAIVEDIFRDKYKQIEHLDLSYNRISHDNSRKMANVLQFADKMRCLHLNGNQTNGLPVTAVGEEYKFFYNDIMPPKCGRRERHTTFIYSRFTGCVHVGGEWAESSKCWLCDPHVPITFTYIPGFTGPYCEKIEILFEFDEWYPRKMEFSGLGRNKSMFQIEASITAMIPRGTVVNYVFRADEKIVFYGSDHLTHWATVNHPEKLFFENADNATSSHELELKSFPNQLHLHSKLTGKSQQFIVNKIFVPKPKKHAVFAHPQTVILPNAYNAVNIDGEPSTADNHFHLKHSVFAEYKHETPRSLCEHFESNFITVAPIILEIVSDNNIELEAVKTILETYYCELRNIFRYYCCIHGLSCFKLTARGLDIFTVQTMMLDYLDCVRDKSFRSSNTHNFTLLQQDVENIFMSVTSRLKTKGLTMSGFILTIIKLSVCKYSKKQAKVKQSVEDGDYHTVKKGHLAIHVKKLLIECIIPFAHRVYAQKFCREYLYLYETNSALLKHFEDLKLVYWKIMSLHKRRELALDKMNEQSMSTQSISENKGTNTSSKDSVILSSSLASEDHGVSDLSLLKILKKYDLLPTEYIENRQGHLLVNLCKGLSSDNLMKGRLCFIEFVQFVCRVHLEILHVEAGGNQILQSHSCLHDHIHENHSENIQLLEHHNKQAGLLDDIPSFIVYGSHIVDSSYHNVIKPKQFSDTLHTTVEKFLNIYRTE